MNTYKFHSKVIIRTPRYALDTNISEALLKSELFKTDFLESIFLASPHLYEASIKWLEGYQFNEKEFKKLIYSLAKYYIRTHSRCTPFGLFSGISLVNWGSETNINIKDSISRYTRLDMNFVCAMAQHLAKMAVIKDRILYYPNNSIYKLNGDLRYVEYYYQKNKRIHQISAVKTNKYITKIISVAKLNGAGIDDLIDSISDETIDRNEAKEFIEQLIEIQILTSQLEPSITGDEYIYQLLKILEHINIDNNLEISKIIEILREIDLKIKELDFNISNNVISYKQLINLIKLLGIEFEENNLFQTDMVLHPSQESVLDIKYQKDILKALETLNSFNDIDTVSNLDSFAKRFSERYDEQEIPLLFALDTETGIGYLAENQSDFTPLLDGIDLTQGESYLLKSSKNKKILFSKLVETIKDGKFEIDLNKIKFDKTENSKCHLAPSFSAIFRLIENDTIFLESLSGSSAANLLGRFAHAKPEIHDLVNEICLHESDLNSNVILAEIIHLPENRTGNILLHPSFREYEIAYLAKASVPNANQIDLNDLYVSVRNEKVILRSKKLSKIIVPRLSNAHNYTYEALPVYQFLCDLQNQGFRQNTSFEWDFLALGFSFLPRASVGNVIISPAMWQFTKSDFIEINNLTDFNSFKIENKIPRFFLLAESDNELLIDSENELLVDLFIYSAKNIANITLKEFLFDRDSKICNQDQLPIANQFIASILCKESKYNGDILPKSNSKVKREFEFGSEWVYYKIYCGAKSADKILQLALAPILKVAYKRKLIDSWFFIRYNDPENHIRIRFHLIDKVNIAELVFLFNSKISTFLKNKTIWKIQTDTYSRELERYDFDAIGLNEQLFCKSSWVILHFLDATSGDNRESVRWLFGIKLVNEMLKLFGYSLAEKLELIGKLSISFGKEFEVKKEQKHQIDSKYREYREIIKQSIESDLLEFDFIIGNYVKESVQIINDLVAFTKKNRNCIKLDYLLSSQIHMQLNRLISSNQRQHELLIYDFLNRYYTSEKARLR